MNTEVTTTTDKSINTIGDNEVMWGAEVDTQDITLPRIQLMQPTSDMVSNGQAVPGDIVHSLDEVVLADKTARVEVLIFRAMKMAYHYENGEYTSTTPWTAEMTGASFDVIRPVFDYYVLIPNQVTEGVAFPLVLRMKGMSVKTARKINTFIKQAQVLRQPSCSWVYSVGSILEENDKGKYFVYDVKKERPSTADELQACKLWFDTTNNATVVVDEGEEI